MTKPYKAKDMHCDNLKNVDCVWRSNQPIVKVLTVQYNTISIDNGLMPNRNVIKDE